MKWLDGWLDKTTESSVRGISQKTSRRGFLGKIAGVVIGPVVGLVGEETATLQHFAEFGVVMMLFLVGLELEPQVLWSMRTRLLGLGGLQVGITVLLVLLIMLMIDQDNQYH